MTQTHRLYVIELNGDPKRVYVGYSYHPAEQRLKQHLAGGHLAAKVFKRRATGRLRPDLYEHLPRYPTRQAAEDAERSLADQLRQHGYSVDEGYSKR